MILGVQLHGVLAKAPMQKEELLCKLKQIGYDRIEPCITMDEESNHVSYWTVSTFGEVFPYLKETGLEVKSAHVFSRNLMADMEKICVFAKQFDIKQIVIKMPDELTDMGLQEAAFSYRRLGEALEQVGARLLIHNGKKEFLAKINGRSAYEYMVDICLGKVGMQFDVGWAAVAGENMISFLSKNEARIEAIHFKDFAMPLSEMKETTVGDGQIDTDLIMQFGRAKGIALVVDQDVFEEPLTDLTKAYWYLMNAGARREHSVSYLNIYDTVTDEIKVIEKFDGL